MTEGAVDRLEAGRKWISRRLVYGEDVLYLVTGGVLALTAGWLLVGTIGSLIAGIREGVLLARSLAVLDTLLLVLMLVELMHTIRVSLETHALVPEPFLIVALIAGVRRVLILTTEASQFIRTDPGMFQMALLELGVLTVYFLVITFSIAWLRRHRSHGEAEVMERIASPEPTEP